MKTRCKWAGSDPLYIKYHDEEWGVPVHDDRKLLECLILEGAQAGVRWMTILKKRQNYREALDNYDPHIMANYSEAKIRELMSNKGIVRHRLKIDSVIANARAYLKVREEFPSFDSYIWSFTGGRIKINTWKSRDEIPKQSPESMAMTKDMLERGFKYVGPATCYAFMQAIGMVNDHTTDCFRHPHNN